MTFQIIDGNGLKDLNKLIHSEDVLALDKQLKNNEVTKGDMWITHYRLLSHNGLFNFSITNRGGGKTYNAKNIAIKNHLTKKIKVYVNKFVEGVQQFIEKKEQFIYLRRYKTELKQMSTFFDAIAKEYPDNKLEVKGHVFYCDGEVCGYAMPLSTAMTSKSLTFEFVTLIIFDEFIIDKGHIRYLDNEVSQFLHFYETVARMRDNVRVLFLGNSISLVNPYFIFWNLQPDTFKRFNRYKFNEDGLPGIVIEIHSNEEFVEKKKRSRLGQLVSGTDFETMAIDNKFVNDNNNFIGKRPNDNNKYYFTLHYKGKNYGVWVNYLEGMFYVSLKYDKTCRAVYAMTTNDFKPNMYLIDNVSKSTHLYAIKKAFLGQYLMFENQFIKTEMYEVMRMIGC